VLSCNTRWLPAAATDPVYGISIDNKFVEYTKERRKMRPYSSNAKVLFELEERAYSLVIPRQTVSFGVNASLF
jgi:hypothetical protein